MQAIHSINFLIAVFFDPSSEDPPQRGEKPHGCWPESLARDVLRSASPMDGNIVRTLIGGLRRDFSSVRFTG